MRTKVSRALGILKYAKKFLQQGTLSKKYHNHKREGLLSPTFVIVAQYGDVAAKLKLITSKDCKIKLPEFLEIAAIMFQQLRLEWPTISDIILSEKATIMYKSTDSLTPE